MIATIVLLSVYLISALAVWTYIRIAHGEDGRWSCVNTDISDVIFVLLPAVNTVFATLLWVFEKSPRQTFVYKKRNCDKFFLIKK